MFVEYGNKHMRSSQLEYTEILQIFHKFIIITIRRSDNTFFQTYTKADNQPFC